MINYFKDFVHYNRNNTVGFILLTLTICLLVGYTIPTLVVVSAGTPVHFGWWLTFPLLFTILTLLHFTLRPLIAKAYN